MGAAVTEPTTAYAQWAPAVTVSFAAGYEPVAEQTVSPFTHRRCTGARHARRTAAHHGLRGHAAAALCVKCDWKTRGGTVLAVGDELSSVQADTTLTAQWTPKSYKVVFVPPRTTACAGTRLPPCVSNATATTCGSTV